MNDHYVEPELSYEEQAEDEAEWALYEEYLHMTDQEFADADPAINQPVVGDTVTYEQVNQQLEDSRAEELLRACEES